MDALREAALSLFNQKSGSPPTTQEACDLLSEACELVPAHLQHRQPTMEDTGRGVQVQESVDYLIQLESDLCRDIQVVKLFQQTRKDTSLCDLVLASVGCRSQPPLVLSKNKGVTIYPVDQLEAPNSADHFQGDN